MQLEPKGWIAGISLLITVIVSVGTSAYTYGALTARVAILERRTDFTEAVAEIKVKLMHLDKQLDRIEDKVENRPHAP